MKKINIFLIVASLFFGSLAQATDLDACTVEVAKDTDGDVTLGYAVKLYNNGFCREGIDIQVPEVWIKSPLIFNNDSGKALVIKTGGREKVTLHVQAPDLNDKAGVFVFTNITSGVTFEGKFDVKIVEGANSNPSGHLTVPLFKITDSENIVFGEAATDNLATIHGELDQMALITGSTNIDFGGFRVDDAQNAVGKVFVDVSSTTDFSLTNVELKGLKGPAINLYGPTTTESAYSLKDVLIESVTSNSDIVAVNINAMAGTLDDLTINNHKGTALKLTNFDETISSNTEFGENGIKLVGTTSPTDAGFNGSNLDQGDGLVIENVTDLGFDKVVDVSNFARGVVLRSATRVSLQSSVYSHDNAQYGVIFEDTTSGTSGQDNEINGTKIYSNFLCGIYFDESANNAHVKILGQVNLSNNDHCGMDASSKSVVKHINDADMILYPYANYLSAENVSDVTEGLYVDLLVAAVNGFTIKELELHRILNEADQTNGATSRVANNNNKGAKQTSVKGVRANTQNGFISIKSPSAVSYGLNNQKGLAKVSAPALVPATSFMQLFTLGSVASTNLPAELTGPGNEPNGNFFAFAKSDDGYVIGVWNGVAKNVTSTAGVPAGCYMASDGVLHRMNDELLDSDGDTLSDNLEDFDGDCVWDEGLETNFALPDTDLDGLTDYTEKLGGTGTNPVKGDTDADGLLDGDELSLGTDPNNPDSDADGLTDGTEVIYGTNPKAGGSDTDGDSILDGADFCPLVNDNQFTCYYANCTPRDPAILGDVVVGAGATDSIGEDDSDNDGIPSSVEDANGNCSYDAGTETDATKLDTDADGINDGLEDASHNGLLDANETNPRQADTDGDCIKDGAESGNDLVVSLQDGETSPLMLDSDGDGINDGEEDNNDNSDLNCNGTVDAGETDPSKADTDADNINDNIDICPFESSQTCVVRYCGQSGKDDWDADADGLSDKSEDLNGNCAWDPNESNPLLSDTDSDLLTDFQESQCETNPNRADTDFDGRSDFDEVTNFGAIELGGECLVVKSQNGTDPTIAQFGGCALVKNNLANQSTLGVTLTIILMAVFFTTLLRQRQEIV